MASPDERNNFCSTNPRPMEWQDKFHPPTCSDASSEFDNAKGGAEYVKILEPHECTHIFLLGWTLVCHSFLLRSVPQVTLWTHKPRATPLPLRPLIT